MTAKITNTKTENTPPKTVLRSVITPGLGFECCLTNMKSSLAALIFVEFQSRFRKKYKTAKVIAANNRMAPNPIARTRIPPAVPITDWECLKSARVESIVPGADIGGREEFSKG